MPPLDLFGKLSLRHLLKPAVLGMLFLISPFWIFATAALSMYFVPWFRPRVLLLELLFLLLAAFFLPAVFWSGIALGVLFFLILGIKELVIVDRERAYETLVLLLSFLMILGFFLMPSSGNWKGIAPFAGALVLGACLALLFRRMPWEGENLLPGETSAAIGGFLVVEGTSAVLFLPLGPFSQAAILFAFTLALTLLIAAWRKQFLGRTLFLASFGFFAAVIIAVVLLANWQV